MLQVASGAPGCFWSAAFLKRFVMHSSVGCHIQILVTWGIYFLRAISWLFHFLLPHAGTVGTAKPIRRETRSSTFSVSGQTTYENTLTHWKDASLSTSSHQLEFFDSASFALSRRQLQSITFSLSLLPSVSAMVVSQAISTNVSAFRSRFCCWLHRQAHSPQTHTHMRTHPHAHTIYYCSNNQILILGFKLKVVLYNDWK